MPWAAPIAPVGGQTHAYKVVLLGHGGVGKTALLRRLTTDTFSGGYVR